MTELEKLNFTLEEKRRELERIHVDCFVLNPRVSELIIEIDEIKKKINALEDKEDNWNGTERNDENWYLWWKW